MNRYIKITSWVILLIMYLPCHSISIEDIREEDVFLPNDKVKCVVEYITKDSTGKPIKDRMTAIQKFDKRGNVLENIRNGYKYIYVYNRKGNMIESCMYHTSSGKLINKRVYEYDKNRILGNIEIMDSMGE